MDRKAKLALGAGIVLAVLWAGLFAYVASAQSIIATPSSCVTGSTCRPTLTWSGFPCAAPAASASPSGGGWTGTKAPSGSQLVSSITATRTYTLTCPEVIVGMGSALLEWTPPISNTDGSPLTDLAGYRAYWGTAQGTYPLMASIQNAGATAYTVNGLTNAAPWFFVVTAVNAAGAESTFSNIATKAISGANETLPAVSRSVTVTVGAGTPPAATDIVTGGTFTTLLNQRRYFVGDLVPISTPAVPGATRYEWEIEHVENRIIDARSTTTPSITWTPTRAGNYTARVRPCNDVGCAAWVSTVDRGYFMHAWLRAPAF